MEKTDNFGKHGHKAFKTNTGTKHLYFYQCFNIIVLKTLTGAGRIKLFNHYFVVKQLSPVIT